MAEARAARLAAIEARLNPASQSQDPSASSSSGTTSEPAKPATPAWQPTEKGDLEKKKEFTKLLYRGVVRDNGYKEASTCVDVRGLTFSSCNRARTGYADMSDTDQDIWQYPPKSQ
jgi:hypothetical protein